MIRRFLLALSLLALPLSFAQVATVSAEDIFDRGVCERFAANDSKRPAVCKDKEVGGKNPIVGPEGVLTTLINLLSIVVAIIAIIVIILAGLRFVTSGTNSQDVHNARERVIYAVIALAIASLAQVMVRFIIGQV